MLLSLDDAHTLQAISILADVIDGVSAPGVIDAALVSKALRQVLATRSQPAFDFASRAFSSLDPQVKRRIAREADAKARDTLELRELVDGIIGSERGSERGSEKAAPAAAAGPPSATIPGPAPRKTPSSQPTGLLSAINTRTRGNKPGS